MSKDLIVFKTSSRFIVSKLKELFSWQKFLLLWCVESFVFFQYKSYWITSNNWIYPSGKISILIRRNFEVRNNISEKCIESFCNLFSIVYDFILFDRCYFKRINRFVGKKSFDRFPESLIVSYMFSIQTIIIFLLFFYLETSVIKVLNANYFQQSNII